MDFGQPIHPAHLLERIVRQVQQTCGLPADCVFETLAEDQDHVEFPPADRFIAIAPVSFSLDAGLFAGAGRYTPGFDGRFRVACLCRFAADQELRNTRELRDKTRSALALFLKVLDGLSGFTVPTTDGTGSYLREPMRCESWDVKPKRVKAGSPWAVVASTWNVKFVMQLPSGTANP